MLSVFTIMKVLFIILLYIIISVNCSRKSYQMPVVRFANNTDKIECPYTVKVSRDPSRVPRKIVHVECLQTGRIRKNTAAMECRQLYYHIKVKYADSSEPRDIRVNASCVVYMPNGVKSQPVKPRVDR